MTAPTGAAPSNGLQSASAAAARVAELQALIARVERGGGTPHASFGAELASASAVSGSAAPAMATASASSLPPAPPLAAAGTPGVGTTAPGAPIPGGTLPPSTPFAAQIEAAAARHGIDPTLLAGLIKAESNFDPSAGSPAGAQGLTQLMPETARGLGVTDPFDPEQSIEGGARYLSEQLRAFDGNAELALAAYNAGPGAVEQHGGVPPFPETQAYVTRVLGYASELGSAGTTGGW